MSECLYVPCYSNRCCAPCEGEYCDKHAGKKCTSCGQQAAHECNYCGQFVCGAPLCNDCEEYVKPGKPFGTWGFVSHGHRRKQPTEATP